MSNNHLNHLNHLNQLNHLNGITFFASNSLTIGIVTCVREHYTFAYEVHYPSFELPRNYLRSPVHRRHYLSKRVLEHCWDTNARLGPLVVGKMYRAERPKVGDALLLRSKSSGNVAQKGMTVLSYLPASWSNPIHAFFQFVSDPRKGEWYLDTHPRHVYDKLLIETRHAILYHVLQMVVKKNFREVVAMLRAPPPDQSLDQIFEIVEETILWTQDMTLWDVFHAQLSFVLKQDPTLYPFEVHEYDVKKTQAEMTELVEFRKQLE